MSLEFDADKSFDENIDAFRKHLEAFDPECAAIFLANQQKLTSDGDPARARANRTAFNAAVVAELERLPKAPGTT